MNTMGSHDNPYSYDDYQVMESSNSWPGGWVLREGTIFYITADGSVERDTEGCILGTVANPFSATAYSEMCSQGTWEGGYVSQGGDILYYPGLGDGGSGDGCGCGCGCGCGSGHGNILSGDDTIMVNGVEIDFSWGEGTVQNGGSVTINSVTGGSATGEWERGYTIVFTVNKTGSTDIYNYSIPEIYRV